MSKARPLELRLYEGLLSQPMGLGRFSPPPVFKAARQAPGVRGAPSLRLSRRLGPCHVALNLAVCPVLSSGFVDT